MQQCTASRHAAQRSVYVNGPLEAKWIFHLAKFRQWARTAESIYSVPVQETAKHRAKFGWPPLSDVAAVMKPTRETLKFARVPQTCQPVSAANGLKFTILWGQVEEILLFNYFFQVVDMCLSCVDTGRQSWANVPGWRIFGDFLRPVFPVSRVQQISDLHSKFAPRPHVWKYGRHPISSCWE